MGRGLGVALLLAAVGCSSFGTDTASPAGTDAGSAGAPFCQAHTTATLCDDFEGRTKVDLKWDQSDATANLATAPALDTQSASTGSASASMAVGALVAGQDASSTLEKETPHTDGDVHAEATLRVDAFGPNDSIWLARIAFGGTQSGERYRIWLYVEGGIYYVQQLGPKMSSATRTKFPVEVRAGDWVHVAIDVSFAKKSIHAKIGGTEQDVPFIPEAITGVLNFSIGVDNAEGPSQPVAVHYDDVLLESK